MKKYLLIIPVIILSFVFIYFNHTYRPVELEGDSFLDYIDKTIDFDIPEGYEMTETSTSSSKTFINGDNYVSLEMNPDYTYFTTYYLLEEKTINGFPGEYYYDEEFGEYGFVFTDNGALYSIITNQEELLSIANHVQ